MPDDTLDTLDDLFPDDGRAPELSTSAKAQWVPDRPAVDVPSAIHEPPPFRPATPEPTPAPLSLSGEFPSLSLYYRSPAPAYETDQMVRRAESFERLRPYVLEMLALIGDNSEASAKLSKLTITDDPELDAHQRDLFVSVGANLAANAKWVGPKVNAERDDVMSLAYDEYLGLGPLGDLWRDEDISEICVDRWDSVSIERNGRLFVTPIRFAGQDHVERVARVMSEHTSDRQVSKANALVSAVLPGARVAFCYGTDVCAAGVSITLRKFRRMLSMRELLQWGSLDDEMARFLAEAVRARAAILVSGSTGSGKTTLINALSSAIPSDERVVTIEDAFELQIDKTTHLVGLQTKERSNQDSQLEFTQADLMKQALRMRPDRIIVGEVREREGARVMLEAANTGHEGTMTTIHANSAADALNRRLSDMVRDAAKPEDVAKREVANAFDLVVQVKRVDGVRLVTEICVVDPTTFNGGVIEPVRIFSGEVVGAGVSASSRFARVGDVPPTSPLATKLTAIGVEPSGIEQATS